MRQSSDELPPVGAILSGPHWPDRVRVVRAEPRGTSRVLIEAVTLDGQAYSKDVIILPDGVLGGWWRKKGHVLHVNDLDAVFEAAPEVLVVGQGAYGRMEVPQQTRRALEAAGIELVALPTEEACQAYNGLCERRSVAAALHLTC